VSSEANHGALFDLAVLAGVSAAQVLEHVEYLCKPGDAVLVSGSLIQTYGNDRSDLDILIVGEGAPRESRLPMIQFIGSRRIDVTLVARGTYDRLRLSARRALVRREPMRMLLEDVDVKLLDRLAHAVLLNEVPPPVWPQDRALASTVVHRWFLDQLREGLAVAALAIAAARQTDTCWVLRQVWDAAIEVRLAMNGNAMFGGKWLYARAERELPELWLDAKVELNRCHPSMREGPDLDAVTECLGAFIGRDLAADRILDMFGLQVSGSTLHRLGDRTVLVPQDVGDIWEFDGEDRRGFAELQPGVVVPVAALSSNARRVGFELYRAGLANLRSSTGEDRCAG
jgi:hypothetical protein